MNEKRNGIFTGERALFASSGIKVYDSLFKDGESPLKESRGVEVYNSTFDWWYPLWYCKDVTLCDTTLTVNGRAAAWYTDNITLKNCTVSAPKTFRRDRGVRFENVSFTASPETLWDCEDVVGKKVRAVGDYFALNSKNMEFDELYLEGKYSFDGVKNVVIRNSKLITKDAFWNSENVTVYDSYVSGEYIGWNAKNLTFVNCTVESLQGLCYIENLVMKNCRLPNTTLAFEYSTVDVEIVGGIDSVINPSGGIIRAESIGELIMESDRVDPGKTQIILK
ncbi:MAG: DUF3737 family protein [Clostridia bacterium]|nr:DUF3737 family protein [Clostridia bacterium]